MLAPMEGQDSRVIACVPTTPFAAMGPLCRGTFPVLLSTRSSGAPRSIPIPGRGLSSATGAGLWGGGRRPDCRVGARCKCLSPYHQSSGRAMPPPRRLRDAEGEPGMRLAAMQQGESEKQVCRPIRRLRCLSAHSRAESDCVSSLVIGNDNTCARKCPSIINCRAPPFLLSLAPASY